MLLTPSWLELLRVRRPWPVLSSSSRISVTADSTTGALAPGNPVDTDTMGGSTSGYSRTARREYPITPKRTSAALTMLANTGRRMEMSEIFMATGFGGVFRYYGSVAPEIQPAGAPRC